MAVRRFRCSKLWMTWCQPRRTRSELQPCIKRITVRIQQETLREKCQPIFLKHVPHH